MTDMNKNQRIAKEYVDNIYRTVSDSLGNDKLSHDIFKETVRDCTLKDIPKNVRFVGSEFIDDCIERRMDEDGY